MYWLILIFITPKSFKGWLSKVKIILEHILELSSDDYNVFFTNIIIIAEPLLEAHSTWL